MEGVLRLVCPMAIYCDWCCVELDFLIAGKSEEIKMNPKTMKRYLTVEFTALGDLTKDSLMNIDEFVRLMMLLGFPGGRENSERLWRTAKRHGAYMNLDQYVHLMSTPEVDSQTNKWRSLFAEFDTDGSGWATPDEVKAGMNRLGLDVKHEVLESMDTDHDGKIDYSEFLKKQLHQGK